MHSDHRYIQALKDNNSALIYEIYDKFFGIVQHLVKINHKAVPDAEDLFQDTVIAIYNRVRAKEFDLTCQFGTLVYAFAKRILLNQLRKKSNNTSITPIEEYESLLITVPDFDVEMDHLERQKRFDRAFLRLDNRSRRLLELYIDGRSMAEIAQILGFKNAESVRVQKVKCIQKLRNYYERD
jgi:RNA polymerase sigma factor (sigma-70 family)